MAGEIRQQHIYNFAINLEPTIVRGKLDVPRCQFVNPRARSQCRYAAHDNGYCGVHALCEFLTTREAALVLGVPVRSVIAALGTPDRSVEYQKDRFQYYWATERVMALVGQIKLRKPRLAKDYTPRFIKRYGKPADALHDACEAMFNLNRYAKHDTCRRQHSAEIYDLKNKLIRLLHQSAYTDAVWLHTIVKPPLTCNRCNGSGQTGATSGFDWGDDDVDWMGDNELLTTSGKCSHCRGTGFYKQALTLRFACFRFTVAGQQFVWHQPIELIDWPVAYTSDPQTNGILPEQTPVDDWTPEREKPLSMLRSKFAAAKALVRWVLGEENL